nr:IS630 family transposase [Candidatus Sigynarchaeota archaeon]
MNPEDVLMFGDECSVRQAPTCMKMWAPKGKTPVVKSPGGRARQQIIGALRPATGEVLSAFAKNLKAPVFIKFLKHIICHYHAAGKIILVVDNAKAHHAKIVQRFLDAVSHKLKVLFLPPYSPELNPIEQFWKYMRYKITHNRYYEHFTDLTSELRGFLVQSKCPSLEVQSRCPLP